MDVPLSNQGHQAGAERIQDDEDDRHDGAVSSGQSLARRRAARDTRNRTAIAIAIAVAVAITRTRARVAAAVASTVAGTGAGKGVRVGADARLAQVDLEQSHAVVLGDDGSRVCRVQRIARLPRRDPVRLAGEVEICAVAASNIGDHVATNDAGARQELNVASRLESRHDVVRAGPGAERDVSLAVLIHDEHVGVGHGSADAEPDPLP